MSNDSAQKRADQLMRSGVVKNAVVSEGKVLVKNQVSGNWEPFTGQQVQNPAGNYLGTNGGRK